MIIKEKHTVEIVIQHNKVTAVYIDYYYTGTIRDGEVKRIGTFDTLAEAKAFAKQEYPNLCTFD